MGDCVLCGKPAGWFRHEHAECRHRHDEYETKIITFFKEALDQQIDPDRFRQLTWDIAQSGYIHDQEYWSVVFQGFAEMIEAALDSDGLTEAEEGRIEGMLSAFDIKLDALTFDDAGKKYAKASMLRQMREGHLPVSTPTVTGFNPLSLDPDEKVIWVFPHSSFMTPRTKTQYVGGSSGVSFRIMRGVYFRTSAFKSTPIKTEYLSTEGIGDFVISSKNVFFYSAGKTMRLPFRKIIAIEPYSDGFSLSRDGVNAKPMIFTVDDPWFAVNAISSLRQLNQKAS